jgi:hypothetical protein
MTVADHPGNLVRAAVPGLLALGILAGAAPARAAAPEPWYHRAACHDALTEVLTGDATAAEAALRPLEHSRDADDVACAVYLRVVKADQEIAIHGDRSERQRQRDRALKRMFGFAKAHAKYGARFADLEIDARMRRVRVLFERDDETAALGEARRVNRLLDARRRGESPTLDFARGAMYSALGQVGGVARMFLGMAGIGGDPEDGYRALRRLTGGESVYRAEALQLARQFAADADEPTALGDPVALGDQLVGAYPMNPQYAYDHAYLLVKRGRAARAQAVLGPHLRRVAAEPDAWAPTMRAKLHYLASRAALKSGAVGEARRHRDAMAGLEANDYDSRLPGLTSAVERAEAAR